jgi:homoserine dehydrogenase
VPEDDLEAGFYISLDVADRPGVLGAVTTAFGAHAVSIRSVEQEGGPGGARLVFVTHRAREGHVRATLAVLGDLDVVERIGGVMRIVGAA